MSKLTFTDDPAPCKRCSKPIEAIYEAQGYVVCENCIVALNYRSWPPYSVGREHYFAMQEPK